MITELARNWWTFVLRGIATLLFGLIALIWPGLTILVLTYVFGFYALLDGFFALVAAWSLRSIGRWWVYLLEGLLSIAAGVIALARPDVTALALLTVIAAWAILTGILEIVAAIRLRKEIENEVWMGLSGAGFHPLRGAPADLAAVRYGHDQLDHRLLRDRLRDLDAGSGVPSAWSGQEDHPGNVWRCLSWAAIGWPEGWPRGHPSGRRWTA